MKIASIIEALQTAGGRGGSLAYRLVHTDQHYDRAMSGCNAPLFQELDEKNIPKQLTKKTFVPFVLFVVKQKKSS